ncbi:hypothetical protein M5K25_023776 [Dendrobium thyrsiflorum]|uniref:Uncharacterized protein n=1 Tax=Dendrobium thyrsiflorum TaxID=117978 RepID=A0ABD0U083_DENTH
MAAMVGENHYGWINKLLLGAKVLMLEFVCALTWHKNCHPGSGLRGSIAQKLPLPCLFSLWTHCPQGNERKASSPRKNELLQLGPITTIPRKRNKASDDIFGRDMTAKAVNKFGLTVSEDAELKLAKLEGVVGEEDPRGRTTRGNCRRSTEEGRKAKQEI